MLIATIILVILALLLLQLPSVQTYVVNKINNSLSQKLDNRISIKDVDINFFNNVDLNGIYIEDQNKDTLAYIASLNVTTSLISLFKNELSISSASLDGAHIHLKRDGDMSTFNYQFIIDAFTKDEVSPNKNEASNFNLDIDRVNFKNTNFVLSDNFTQSYLDARLHSGAIEIKVFDIINNNYLVDQLILSDAKVNYVYTSNPNKAQTDLVFPSLPLALSIEDFSISDVAFSMKAKDSIAKKGKLVYDNISLSNLQVEGQDLRIDSTRISGQLTDLQGSDHSGLNVKNMSTEFLLDHQSIQIKDLKLTTPHSTITNSSLLSFGTFSDLQRIENLKINSDFENSSIGREDIQYFIDVNSDILSEHSLTSEKIKINGKVIGDTKHLELSKLNIRIPTLLNIKIDGHINDMLSKDLISFDLKIEELKTSAIKLNKLLADKTIPDELKPLGDISLTGDFKGDLASFKVDNLDLSTSAKTSAILSGVVKNLLDPQKVYLDVNIEEVKSHLHDIKQIVKGELPAAIRDGGAILYSGQYKGTLSKFDLNGNLSTDIGNASTDLFLHFTNNYKEAEYNGSVSLKDFDLGSVLENEDFGSVNIDINTKGAGLDFESLDNQVNAQVSSLEYKDIVYENFNFNGSISQKKIKGKFNIDNKNAKAQFNGMLDLNEEQPNMDFQLAVDTLELNSLNISDQNIAFSGIASVKGKGKSLDEFIGNIEIEKLFLSNDTLNYYTDSLVINSVLNKNKERALDFNSEGAKASIVGNYSISNLPLYINNIVDQYIPVDWFSDMTDKNSALLDEAQIFEAVINIDDEKLIKLFIPKLEQLNSLAVKASINSEKDSLSINGNIESITYAGITSNSITTRTRAINNSIQNRINLKDTEGIGNLFLPNTTINARLQKDSLLTRFEVKNDTLANLLNIAAALTKEEDLYKMRFRDFLQLDSARWAIAPENYIKFKENYIDVNALSISKDMQSIEIISDASKTKGAAPININIKSFDVHELTNLYALENQFLYGTADATLSIEDILTELKYSGLLQISDLIVEEQDIGNLKLNATKRDQSQIIDLDMAINGSNNDLIGKGYIDLDTRNIKFNSTFENLNLALFDPFLVNIISDSKGDFGGNISIEGSLDKPIINGNINTNELSTLIAFSNVRYNINKQNIKINNSEIEFSEVSLTDQNEKTAIVNGKINHNSFTEFYYDLLIQAQEFQILNTTVEDNPLFYGTLYLDATASVNGPLNLPNLEVDAKSLANSEFHLSPFIESQTISQDDYIIFTNKDFNDLDTVEVELYQLKNTLPVNLSLNLGIDPNTEFQFIVDPLSGDHLSCFGNANLQVEILQNGDIKVFGTYIVDSGKYLLSYDNFIKREFELVSGGQVDFQGDPLLARLDVNAVYKTKATPSALLNDTGNLSAAELSEINKRTDVQILLNMAGSINDLALDFGLNFPNNEFGPSTSVGRRVNEIESNEEELYNQVFGLLLLNSFITTNSSNLDINTASNIALKSVSGLVENRINSFADGLIKGLEIDFNVDSYNSAYIAAGQNTSVTEFGLGLTKKLLDDRLSIKVQGNLDVDNRNKGAAFSGIAGDVILEYKLNKKGNYSLSVFRKSDFNLIQNLNANKNGASISIKKKLYLKNAKGKSDE